MQTFGNIYSFNLVITAKSSLNTGSILLKADYFHELVLMYENVAFVRSMVSADETVIEIKNISKLNKLRVR